MPRDVDEIRVLKRNGYFGITLPITAILRGTTAATVANYLALFFIAQRSYEIIEVKERHETLGTDGSAVTVMLNKVPDGTAPASGTSVLKSGFNLKAIINTLQTGSITDTVANKRLITGDGLALEITGTPTNVAGVTISVLLKAI